MELKNEFTFKNQDKTIYKRNLFSRKAGGWKVILKLPVFVLERKVLEYSIWVERINLSGDVAKG